MGGTCCLLHFPQLFCAPPRRPGSSASRSGSSRFHRQRLTFGCEKLRLWPRFLIHDAKRNKALPLARTKVPLVELGLASAFTRRQLCCLPPSGYSFIHRSSRTSQPEFMTRCAPSATGSKPE